MKIFSSVLICSLSLLFSQIGTSQELNVKWEPREDLNILLPNSIKIYDTYGKLADGEPVRATYAEVDLRDENLKLRAHGSHKKRQTTLEAYEQFHGILAINGGYFSDTSSVNVLVSDGEVISAGHSGEQPRGAFGMVRGEPQIVWANAKNSFFPHKYETPKLSSKME